MNQGDHLRVLRGGVWDHAIDLGDRTVIRFLPGRGLERTSHAGFTEGAEQVEVVIHRERTYRPPLVVARAFSRMAESAFAGMFASAEQFATWCKSGTMPPAAAGEAAAPAARARRPGKPARSTRARKAKPARKAARKVTGRPTRKPARRAAPRKVARKPVAKATARSRSRSASRRPARSSRKRR